MSLILQTITNNGLNITTETATSVYTAPSEKLVCVQFRLSNLANTGASITFRIEHLNSSDNIIAKQCEISTYSKYVATDTIFGGRMSSPVLLKAGEKLKCWYLSNNASDTNVTSNLDIIDCAKTMLNADKTDYTITSTQENNIINSVVYDIINNSDIRGVIANAKGKVVKTGNSVEFYDTDGVTLLYTLTYAAGERTRTDVGE